MNQIQRFLLVDDNESDNLLHSITLKRSGFQGEVHCFDGGRAALEYLQHTDLTLPTLILLDVNMPEMDGFAFVRAATPLLENSPISIVLMLTFLAADQDRQQAQQIPLIRDFITKPLTTEQILRLLASNPD